ncbi:MAG TPA: leucyl/phenylalanyl-tRNA--protein transferase [Labilithrix sp.]|nr:leucyl/phenylalanyl-tRNA--protein transferase [Labilithrix sp.]
MTDSHGIDIREANLDAAEQITAIVAILDAHARSDASHGAPLADAVKQGLVASLKREGDPLVLLAYAGAVPIGVAVCLGGAATFDPRVLRLHDVAVTPDYAGERSHVAMLLMQAAEVHARAKAEPAETDTKREPELYPRVGVDVLQDWNVFVGGNVTPELYLSGLRHGAFLLSTGNAQRWCDPARRAVFPLETVKWPKTVQRAMRRPQFTVTIDRAFVDVVRACGDRPGSQSWLSEDVIAVESALHERGLAHSVEVWNTETKKLVGGIFGVAVGALFAGESMFHRETDASKVAFAALVECLRAAQFRLFDVQLMTPHLASLGCIEISRVQYKKELAASVDLASAFPRQVPSAARMTDARS